MGGFFGRRKPDLSQVVDALERIADALWKIVRKMEQGPAPARGGFNFTVGAPEPKEDTKVALTVQSTNREKIPITLTPNEPVDGDVRISVESGDGTLLPDPGGDPTKYSLVSPDTPGPAVTTYHVEADADRTEGVVLITETIVYTTDSAMATTIGVTFGAPEPK